MKNFCYYLLILSIVLEVLSAQNVSNDFDICEVNNGNIQINEAFRWKSHLFVFGENGLHFKVSGFKWDPNNKEFSFEKTQRLNSKEWNATAIKLTFPVDYPGIGLRIVKVIIGETNTITQLLGYLLGLDDSGGITSIQEISINLYKCGSNPEAMNLCSLFGKFPQDNLADNLMSMSSFPPSIEGFSPRFFVYFKETPPKLKQHECSDCYKSRRYIMIGKNVSHEKEDNQTNWRIDNTTDVRCVDLNGVLVNSSLSLTDYTEDGNRYQFDWIEFSGTQYIISRVSVKEDQVLDDIEKIASDSIGTIFKCHQPMTTPSTSSKQSTESPERPEGLGTTLTKAPIDRTSTPLPTSKSSEGGFPVIWIIFIILLVLLIIGVIVWFLLSRRGGTAKPTPPPTPPPSATLAPASPPGPAVDISEAGVTPTPSETKTIRSDTGIE